LLLFSTNAVIKHRVPIHCCQIVQWPGGSVIGKNCKIVLADIIKSCGRVQN